MKKILVPLDFSPITDAVVATAAELASLAGSSVVLLHVGAPDPDFVGFDAGPQVVRDQEAHHLKEERRQLTEVEAKLSAQGVKVESIMTRGATVETILDRANENGIDLIIMGSHGRGLLARALLGSVSEGVLRGAACRVMIVPASVKEDT